MDKPTQETGFLKELGRELRQVWQAANDALENSGVAIRNQLRLARQARLDYVVLPVGGPLPERAGPPRSFLQRQLPLPPEPLSLQALNYRLRAVADAANVRGVVFVFQGFSAGLASLQNFRASVQRLRNAGKQAVVYTPYLDLPHYFAATAADRIVAPPGVMFDVLGLRSEAVFLKDALARLGVEADVLQISPYKTAFDALNKAEMSPEHRQQINWLLDEMFDVVTAAIAAGRNKSQDEIKALIDQAPLLAEEALAHGLVDDLGYEDNLAHLLAGKCQAKGASESSEAGPAAGDPAAGEDAQETSEEPTRGKPPKQGKPQVRLLPWSRARDLLLEKARRTTPRYIGVISLEGTIAMGPSRQPPIDIPVPFVGGAVAGEATLSQLLREAEQDDKMAALIFHVDSGGGSSLASDLIGRQIERINQKKPVLAYMGNVAASGGYYISATARHIMAQPTTLTGSIGVITAHLSTAGLYNKLSVNRVSLARGRHAALYSDETPLTVEERQLLWRGVVDTYHQFKQVVARGRALPLEELDPICEGRVWTGRQAVGHMLVDSHGDFVDAVRQVAGLAGLPTDDAHTIPLINLHPHDRGDYLLPQPFEAAEEVLRLLSADHLRQWLNRPLWLMPFQIKFW
ncbi:MAG: signal peptide peptidase SppA [Chloroflexi bacterium]|nr:signal peptide peptidase SppA [Chloroflexota bacterium]MCI0580950.1 signal peptide peptidase SppA [Chloroflexota bacterium]MCI0645038.1 signal peptide peptidase SppA [Chloroflexota bacterium]MCI0725613.1 signal peptide peptidase SppA [Chloroflexota bacterium]